MPVRSTDDVVELMRLGQKNRAVGSTSLNDRSSRSHSVVTVHVQGTDLDSGNIFRGSLHLVDLAGSERVDKSEVTGDRLKEAQHINKSLSALGDVISALAQKNGHVPYRNSKLTQLLQDSLGGQAKTLMFVHISPDAESFGETISTLKFAERVATVELGAARSNKESGEIQTLKDQVNQLKDFVAKRDAEIAFLRTTVEQLENPNTDNNNNNSTDPKSKSKPTNASKPRRRTRNEPQPQRNRKSTAENGNANAEASQSMRKNPGGKKTPTSLVMSSTGHDPEDSTEHFDSSSACSQVDSPSENKVHFEVSEAGAPVNNVFEKLKLLKSRRGNGNHRGHTNTTTTIEKSLDDAQPCGDDALSSWQDFEQFKGDNGRYARASQVSNCDAPAAAAAAAASNLQSGLRQHHHHRPQFSSSSGQDPANRSFETILLETIGGNIVPGQNAQLDVVAAGKRTSFLLNDVGLDADYGDESEVFESRGTCQDDTGSLYSDSGMSGEADVSGSSQVEQYKKGRSTASSRPHHDRKGVLQSEVSATPVTSASRASPMKGDRKSTAGLTQVRSRKQKVAGNAGNAGNAAAFAVADKPPPKRSALPPGNSNQEVEHASNRRSTIGTTSLTTWR